MGGWYPSMPSRWYPSMPCRSLGEGRCIPACLPGFQAYTQRGLAWVVSNPTPRGEVEGSGLGGSQAHTQGGDWGVWPGGSPHPHLGGLQAHTWGEVEGSGLGGLEAHTWGEVEGSGQGGLQGHTWGGLQAHTQGVVYPSMHQGRCPHPQLTASCRQYASYWKAFLLFNKNPDPPCFSC